jgi:hypothetical protein
MDMVHKSLELLWLGKLCKQGIRHHYGVVLSFLLHMDKEHMLLDRSYKLGNSHRFCVAYRALHRMGMVHKYLERVLDLVWVDIPSIVDTWNVFSIIFRE